jgi:transposase
MIAELPHRLREIVRLYQSGWTLDGIATKLRVKPHTVSTYASMARRLGISLSRRCPQRARRMDHHAAARMSREGMTQAAIADHFGVRRTHVSRILRRLAEAGALVGPRGRWPGKASTADLFERALVVGIKQTAIEHGVEPRSIASRFSKAGISIRIERAARGLPAFPPSTRRPAVPMDRGDVAAAPAVPAIATSQDVGSPVFLPGNNSRAAAGSVAPFQEPA